MSEIHIHVNRRVNQPEERPTRLSAFILWAIAAGGLIVSSLLSGMVSPLMQGMNPHLQMLVINLLYYLPFVALPAALLVMRRPKTGMALRPNPIGLFNTITIVILAVLGVFFANDIVVLWSIPFQKLGFDVFTASLPAAQNTGELMLSVITVAVIPAVCEEVLFRGVIMSSLEDGGTRHAFLMSALLFSLVHGSIIGMPTQIILGVILAAVVFWSNSIYAGLIYHTVHNATAVLLDFVQRQAPADAAQTIDLLEAIGGFGGLISLVIGIVLVGAMISFSLRMARLRGMLMGISAQERKKIPLQRREWAVLLCGLALCAVLYASDIALMLGGI